jgi:hypothetical protein
MKLDGTRSKLPKTIGLPASMRNDNSREAWRVLGIMSELVAAPGKLDQIHPE